PTVYYNDGDKYLRLTSAMKAYYIGGSNDPDEDHIDVSLFPRNLSMVMGDSHGNTPFPFEHIRFICVNADGTNGKTYHDGFLDDGFCPGGLRIVYIFPSCWNSGRYKPDQSHMAYPTDSTPETKGTCPDTHPRRIFQVQLEHQIALPDF
ncbi:unnamed protein product, partial [Phaeothamnion confervicola]